MNVDDLQLQASPLGPIGPGPGKAGGAAKPSIGPSFGDVMQQALTVPATEAPAPAAAPAAEPTSSLGPPVATSLPDLKLSAHAQQRLSSRKINLDQRDWDKIQAGVEKAAAKGSKEALVMSDKAALVVSIKNRTVITAVDPASMKDNVFTNIDSAVIV